MTLLQGTPHAMQWVRRSTLHVVGGFILLLLLVLTDASSEGDMTYIIASIPKQLLVVYMTLPDMTIHTLFDFLQGVVPTSIAYHPPTGRLFVVDNVVLKVYYYQLIQLPDGRLITDGRRSIALENVNVHHICLDDVGNLFWSGRALSPPPVIAFGPEAVFKHPWIFLVQGNKVEGKLDGIWNDGNSGDMKKIYNPGPLLCDGSTIYVGNQRGGKDHGSLLRLPTAAPDMRPGNAISILSDNTDGVLGITMGPRFVFWGTSAGDDPTHASGDGRQGIWGIPKSKATTGCGQFERECKRITDEVFEPASLKWDGDGTVYFVDRQSYGIYSFPSGNLQPHRPTLLATLGGRPYAMELLTLSSSKSAPNHGGQLAIALAALSALAPWMGFLYL